MEVDSDQFYEYDDYQEEHKALQKTKLTQELKIFLKNRGRSKEYQALKDVEAKHYSALYKASFAKRTLLNKGEADFARIRVLDWLIKKVRDVMISLHMHSFWRAVPEVLKIGLVCKSLIDKSLLKESQTLLGTLYLHLGKIPEALAIFDLLRDVAEECHNWSFAL